MFTAVLAVMKKARWGRRRRAAAAIPLSLMLVLVAVTVGRTRHANADADEPRPVWDSIATYFKPPAEYAGKLGDYRSPLLFDDGSPVKTPEDWPKRRRQILDHWHGVMGKWPPVIEKPSIDYL